MSATVTAPTFYLRPGLLADLEQPSAAALASLVGWDDVAHLAAALDGEPASLLLLSVLAHHYVVTPFAYFATTV